MNDRDTTAEQAFRQISQTLDEVGPEQHVAYLAKLSLLLCEELGDSDRVGSLIESAKLDL